MSTALQLHWIHKRVIGRDPQFSRLITAAVFGVDCDAGFLVQVPCIQRPGQPDLVKNLHSYLYLRSDDLPSAADEDIDMDDSPTEQPTARLRWKLPKAHAKLNRQLGTVQFDGILGFDGHKATHLDNQFTLFYVKQAHAKHKYPPNSLVAKLAQKYYHTCAREFNGGVLVVKNAASEHAKATHVTQEDMSVIRVLVG
ncbi:hypothetical protein BJ138DRAFT_1105634, partial [Hygrophoropsis aurantiaca]